MMPTGFEWTVIGGTIIIPIIEFVIGAIVAYFVIKKAVAAALREHDEARGGQER